MPRVRDADRVRLITRGGYDWTKRFPWIVETKNRQKRVDNQADDNDAVPA
jgi:ATP-dependent DNA ligase